MRVAGCGLRAESGRKNPAGHLEQALRRVTLAKVPGGQAKHLLRPGVGWYVPSGQSWQASADVLRSNGLKVAACRGRSGEQGGANARGERLREQNARMLCQNARMPACASRTQCSVHSVCSVCSV